MLLFTAKDLIIGGLIGGFLALGVFTWTRWWVRKKIATLKSWWASNK